MSPSFNRAILALSLLLLILAPRDLIAQGAGAAAETLKILGISVEGNREGTGTETDAIISNSGLRVGEEIQVPGDRIHQAMQRLWALKIFSDIRITIEQRLENGIYLVIAVSEYPRLGKVVFEGNHDISEDDLKSATGAVTGQILTPDDIRRMTEAVKQKYSKEGRLLTTVTADTASTEGGKPNEVTVTMHIDEGPSVEIDRITVTGTKAFSGDEVKSQMDDTEEKSWLPFSNADFDPDKYRKDKEKIISFYRRNGYLDAEIVSDSTWYSPDRRKINIQINVDEGARYFVRDIVWEGSTVYPTALLSSRLQFARGDVFNQERFESNLRGNAEQTDVASLYLDNGYLTFGLDPEIRRTGSDSVDIIIRIYERNQYRIGRVDIRGNTKTEDKVIRRELFTRPGDFFNRSRIIRSLRQLSQLNYFNPENLRPDYKLNDDNETVNLIYDVEEKSSDNVNASVGYSDAFGVTGALGFTITNFSLSNPLQGGAGQIFNFEWQFGEGNRYRTFSLGFTEPWLYGSPTTLGVSLFDTRQIYVYDLRQTGVSLRLGRRLDWPDNYFRLDWNVRFQNNDVRDNGGNYLIQVGKTTQYSITQTISRNSTDSPIFPSEGSNVALSFELSGGPFLPGNVQYHKEIFSADWYTRLFGTDRISLAASSLFGYLDGISGTPNIPPIEYFYMGGTGVGYVSTTQLRGYEDRSIGPRDRLGQPIGGRAMVKDMLELRFALTLNPIPIYLLTFAEGGNVFADFLHADIFDLKRSYGFGARLLINPIGMVGFDYGYGADDVYPLDGKPDGWRFHFQFGKGF
jgi:outer membrane protein insertion porin family